MKKKSKLVIRKVILVKEVKQMRKENLKMTKKFDVWEHYDERESWNCKHCDEEIEASNRSLILHLEEKHNIKVEE